MAKRSRCECGRVKSKWVPRCDKCDANRREARNTEMQAILAGGRCPDCGAEIRQNLALTGWHQCAQFGAEGFRKDSSRPSCNWQGFVAE